MRSTTAISRVFRALHPLRAPRAFRIPRALHVLTLLAALGLLGRTGQPARAQTPLEPGVIQQATIRVAGEEDRYTITLSAGDVLVARASRMSGDLWPSLRLTSPSGVALGLDSATSTAEIERSVSTDGTYTLTVRDGYDGTHTGDYGLYVQVANRPGATEPNFQLGVTALGVIASPAQMRAYTVPVRAGDVIVSRMSRMSGNLWPLIRIYTPAGNRLQQQKSSVSTDLTQTAPVDGNYTVLLGDGFDGTYVGDYGFFAQRVNRPENAVALASGATVNGSIATPGAMQTYTIAVPPGPKVTLALQMTSTSGNLWPLVRVYGADGAFLGEAEGGQSVTLQVTVAGGQTLTVLTGDGFNGTYIGQYRLSWSVVGPGMVRALWLAGGLVGATSSDITQLDRVTTPGSAGRIDLRDAVWAARHAAGL